MSRIPITDPTLRLLVLRQLLHSERPEASALKVLADIRALPLLELTELTRFLRADTMVIGLGDIEHPPASFITPHVQFPVTDAATRTLILSHLIQHAQAKAPDEAAHSRMAPLRALFRSEPLSATESASPEFKVRVSLPHLAWDFTLHQRMATEREMFHYFVKAHASSRMLAALFQVTPSKVRAAQRLLGVNPRAGRCTSPSEADQINLVAEWDRMTSQERPTPREMFYRLHQEHPHFTMAQLYGVIKKEKKVYATYSVTTPPQARESCVAPLRWQDGQSACQRQPRAAHFDETPPSALRTKARLRPARLAA